MKRGKSAKVGFVLVCVAVIIALIVGKGCNMMNSITNIFDETFYTWVNPSIVKTSFSNVEVFNKPEKAYIDEEYSNNAIINVSIKQEHNTVYKKSSRIIIIPESSTISYSLTFTMISEEKDSSNSRVFIDIILDYDIQTNIASFEPLTMSSTEYNLEPKEEPDLIYEEMKKMGITIDDIERNKSLLLYEIAIDAWVDGNASLSRYSADNPGEYELIDNTWTVEGWDAYK